MVRRCYKVLILFFLLVMCGCSKTKEPSIRQPGEGWEVTDIELNNLPQDTNTYVASVTDKGVYYFRDLADAKSLYFDAEWHFLTFSGEDILVYKEASVSCYTLTKNGTKLIVAISIDHDMGTKVLELSPDGNTRELFQQNSPQFPFISASDNLIASIRNNYQTNEKLYDNTLVLTNTSTGTETIIYQTTQQIDSLIGEDILSVCLVDQNIIFTVKETLIDESQYWLFTYNITKEKITDKIPLEQNALYAVRMGNTAIMSFDNEMGSIGEIVDDHYQEKSKIPLMSSANLIRNSVYTPEGIYISCYLSEYFWDTNTNEIYVYDVKPIYTEGRTTTKKGIQYIIREGNEAFVRTLSVE